MSGGKEQSASPSVNANSVGNTRVLPVRIDEVYTLAEFQQRTRMSRSAIRSARRRGLRVTQCGKRCYVAGSDWVAFLAKLN